MIERQPMLAIALLLVLFGACAKPTVIESEGLLVSGSPRLATTMRQSHEGGASTVSPPTAPIPRCGNASLEIGEECEDGNLIPGDGCSPRCRAEAAQVASNGLQTCIVTSTGGVKCWGENHLGQLGYGDTNNRGDEPGEMGEALHYVDLGPGKAVKVTPGRASTCAILANGKIKCWGGNLTGNVPDTMGVQLQAAPLEADAVLLDATNDVCVALNSGKLKCVTNRACNDLGFARDNCSLHQDKFRLMWTPVLIKTERRIVQVTSGSPDCALLDNGTVKCWGASWPAVGQTWKTMMSGVFKKEVPNVPLKTSKKVTYVASNFGQVCVILETGEVGCWGEASTAKALGYYAPEKNEHPGRDRDSEDPPSPDAFWHTDLPKKLMRFEANAIEVLPSPDGGCVVLENNKIKCWQEKSFVAVEETAGPRAIIMDGQVTTPPVFTIKLPVNCKIRDVSLAGNFCVLCEGGCLKCWGDNSNGQLGYGDTKPRQEPPDECVDY